MDALGQEDDQEDEGQPVDDLGKTNKLPSVSNPEILFQRNSGDISLNSF